MTSNKPFSVRLMKPEDLSQALALSTAESWNQTEKDWRLLLENQDNICIVAEKDNKVAGTATALVHSGKIAWIGMVIVDKALRGLGAGKMLMRQIIEKLKYIESVKLDATPAGYPLYKSLGFIDEYKIFRMTNQSLDSFGYVQENDAMQGDDVTKGIPGFQTCRLEDLWTCGLPDLQTCGLADLQKCGPEDLETCRLEDLMTSILRLDERIFGVNRKYMLDKLIESYPEKAFIARSRGSLNGYVLGREGTRFSYVGPLYAESFETARSLMSKSLISLRGKPVALDVPERQDEFIKWLESAGFVKQRHFIRMYLGKNPFPGVPESQYLISGPEYG